MFGGSGFQPRFIRAIAVKNRSHNPKTTDTKLQSYPVVFQAGGAAEPLNGYNGLGHTCFFKFIYVFFRIAQFPEYIRCALAKIHGRGANRSRSFTQLDRHADGL